MFNINKRTQDITMNVEEKIQLNGYKVDSGVFYAYFPKVCVTNEIFHSNVDYRVENGCNDNDFEEIDSEFQSDVVNYNERDDDCDDLNGYNDNDFEDLDSQFQNEVASYNEHDGDCGDDFNKDHYHGDHDYDYDGNGCVNNPDCDDTFHHHDNDDDDNVGDEDDDFDDEDIGYGATNAGEDDDRDDGVVYYQYNEFNENTTVTVRYCDSSEDSGDKTYNDNCASEYFTCEDDGDVDDHDILQHDDGVKTVDRDSHGKIAKLYSSVQLIKCNDLCSTKQYENVMNTLEEFQTQSEWEEHKRLTSGLQRGEINVDLKIVLLLEQGMAEIMQKHFSLGKKLFRRALRLCSQSKNLCLLQGRALMFLGNAYRKEGPIKYGKAFKSLTLAQQNLFLVESKEDKAELNYFLGVLYLNMLSISTHEPSQRSRDRIEKHYQAVYDYAMAESASRVREKIQKIFPLGMANFLLDGQTELARSRVVPETKLKKAEDCLKYFAHHFPFDEQPVSMQTDYCKSMSDLEYRRGNLHISQEFLEKGLKIAKMHGYHLEVQSLEKRLLLLEKCLPRVSVFFPLEDIANLADQSSMADSEVNVFSSGSE